ncbi:MAG: M14 family metallopeptidase [Pseudomonadota bacterium]|nr:M14 family metallopeptidase [Pseudomonadota bacterium]
MPGQRMLVAVFELSWKAYGCERAANGPHTVAVGGRFVAQDSAYTAAFADWGPHMLPAVLLTFALSAPSADWTTPAEASKFTETPRYAQTMAYFERLDAASDKLCMKTFGKSPQGRALNVVVIAAKGECTPEQVHASGKEIVWIQAAIHPGENEGKDALMAFARDLTVLGKHDAMLKHVVLVAIPIFNVDGHERFSPYNRINQNGPNAMGWRATAQNLNLNRDYIKADAPEMQAWLRLWNAWQPDLLIDLHNTNGADYQYQLTWKFETAPNIHPALAEWNREALGKRVQRAMYRRDWKLFEYITPVDDTDIAAGLLMDASGPRYSTGYAAVANRAGLLIETHMLKDFRTRTLVNQDLLLEVLSEIGRNPGRLRAAVRKAEAVTIARVSTPDKPLPMGFALSERSLDRRFLGVAYTRTDSPISGAKWIEYDPKTPRNFNVSVRDDVQTTLSVAAPAAYLVPVQWQQVIDKLDLHGITYTRLDSDKRLRASAYRFDKVEWARQPFEGRLPITTLEQHEESAEFAVPAGSVLVNTAQPRGDLAMHLFEPQAPDALIRWGFFNAIFEQKEYAEPRVLERMARNMLAADSELQAQFDEKLKDPVFAADRWARLYFFYQRSPYFDAEYMRYPVLKLSPDELAQLPGDDETNSRN